MLYFIVMQTTLTAKNNVAWTHLKHPTAEELAALVRAAGLTPVDAEFVAQNYHRPDITVHPTYLLVLVHVPTFNKQTRVTTSGSLFLIVKDSHVWSVVYEPIAALDQLWDDFTNNSEKQNEYFSAGPAGLALHIVNVMYGSCFHKLERLNKHINIAEDAVFQGNEKSMVVEISILVRDVMDFRKIIRPQQSLFAAPPQHPLLTEPDRELWLRLHNQVQKLWEVLESLSEATRQLSQTNNTLLQHKQNQLLRVLTYYSILSIPIYIILAPLDPFAAASSRSAVITYWGLLSALILALVIIFIRFRGKRVL